MVARFTLLDRLGDRLRRAVAMRRALPHGFVRHQPRLPSAGAVGNADLIAASARAGSTAGRCCGHADVALQARRKSAAVVARIVLSPVSA